MLQRRQFVAGFDQRRRRRAGLLLEELMLFRVFRKVGDEIKKILICLALRLFELLLLFCVTLVP